VREPRQLREGPVDIPWDNRTTAKKNSPTRIGLESELIWAEVDGWANVHLWHNTDETIKRYLDRDETLTDLARKTIEGCSDSWHRLKEVFWSNKEESLNRIFIRPGKKEWRPEEELVRVTFKMGEWQSGYTSSEDFNVNRNFDFIHFYEANEGLDHEGLVVLWNSPEVVEVWVGEVSEFLYELQTPRDYDEYPGFNRALDNGLLWALDLFGFLEDPEFYESSESKWVVEAFEDDPFCLWPDLVDRLRPQFGLMPKAVKKAVATFDRQRRLDMERATGQGYFWPEIYPGGIRSHV